MRTHGADHRSVHPAVPTSAPEPVRRQRHRRGTAHRERAAGEAPRSGAPEAAHRRKCRPAPAATRFGTANTVPAITRIAAVRIGFRASRNGPPVTSVVCSVSSTPIRQEAPRADWAVMVAPAASTAKPEPGQAKPAAVEDTEAWRAGQACDRSGQPGGDRAKASRGRRPPAASLVGRPSELRR